MNKRVSIGIIGAGLAGLTCAQKLTQQGFDVQVFEAQSYIGGRIIGDKTFAQLPLEIGAEILHMSTDFYKMTEKHGAELMFIDEFQRCQDLEDESKMLSSEEFCQKYPQADEAIDTMIENFDQVENEQSLDDYFFKTLKIEDKYRYILRSMFGIEYGSSLKNLSAKGIARTENEWDPEIESYLVTNMSFQNIIDKEYGDLYHLVQLNTVIQKISYQQNDNQRFVKLVDQDQKEYKFDIVVVCTPINQLKKLTFTPELSQERINAASNMHHGRGGKLFIKFKKQFWEETHYFFLMNSKFPYFWSESYRTMMIDEQSVKQDPILCFFLGTEELELIDEIGQEEALNIIFGDLQKLFNDNIKELYNSHIIYDWSKTSFIDGSYSCDMHYDTYNFRNILKQNIQNLIYFAGEGYHTSHPTTLDGAYDTAIATSQEIIKFLQQENILQNLEKLDLNEGGESQQKQ